jgi:hypothetical protein
MFMFLKHLGCLAFPITKGFSFYLWILKLPTDGWKVGSRFSIGFFKVCGESADVDDNVVDDFRSKIGKIGVVFTEMWYFLRTVACIRFSF